MSEAGDAGLCPCRERPSWARLDDDSVMRWPVVEIAEWEELRRCPQCGAFWLTVWPEEIDGAAILCRPVPESAHRLRDVDHAKTLRKYCLARIEEHLGALRERKIPCKKVACPRRRIEGASYCLEHLIAERFGRHLAFLDRSSGADV